MKIQFYQSVRARYIVPVQESLSEFSNGLLEAGVNLRLIQTYLGHESLSTTAIYTHLTRHAETVASETIDRLMTPLAAMAEWEQIVPAASEEPW